MSDKPFTPVNYSIPEIYMPLLQFIVRLSLAALTVIYFNWLPLPALILNKLQIFLIISAFVVFHLLWWWNYKIRGASLFAIRLGAWVDLGGAVTGTLVDPFLTPPMILLILIAVLGDGIQHGLKMFLEMLFAALVLIIIIFPLRHFMIGEPPPYGLFFLIFLMAFALYYAYMLIRRIEKMKKEAEEMGDQDPLTGLLNRRAFSKSAKYLLSLHERSKMPLVVMFADLDDFKQVNDNFGHEMGDRVLQYFAKLVKEKLRRSDISARYGGDEFVFILTDISLEGSESVALRLQREFTDWAGSREMKVGVSFGLGAVPEGGMEIEEILHHVDSALYDAKQKKGQAGSISVLTIEAEGSY
ncbi:MAG: GGDEF domain-containing protein [Deltaproteobacteria bacterium]|nr:GGDEF domain-containing protein [Deltaproteobacteria bacterium]MBN2845134.1 GGDEF domain-containing protein [Deltaproteobacteria bacterium]